MNSFSMYLVGNYCVPVNKKCSISALMELTLRDTYLFVQAIISTEQFLDGHCQHWFFCLSYISASKAHHCFMFSILSMKSLMRFPLPNCNLIAILSPINYSVQFTFTGGFSCPLIHWLCICSYSNHIYYIWTWLVTLSEENLNF